jgi:diguanylate cyclase (GGDEF)-like protein
MIDIDHFKLVNDTHGHLVGDDVIREVAQRLAHGLRSTDVVGRYGGEEFAVVLPEADGGDTVPERLRAAVADVPVPTRSGPVSVTVSIGMTWLQPGDDVTSALSRADTALYRAKQGGRNRIEIAPESD